MTSFEQQAIQQMRVLHETLSERHAGLAVLHLDAAIAALESHVRRHAASEQAALTHSAN